jgi:hypothetical protein
MKIHSYHKTPKGTELPLMDLHGQPYLKVPHRVVWFRELHPNARIQTDPVTIGPDSALFRATIYAESGEILATAHKFEDRKGFADYIEKAETGAIGRALGLCGFGTQFTGNEFDEGERLADSPTQNLDTSTNRPAQTQRTQPQPTRTSTSQDSGDYVVKFGKHKGKVVREHVNDLMGYKSYLLNTARSEGKSVGGMAQEFIDHLDAFLENAIDDEMMNWGEKLPF